MRLYDQYRPMDFDKVVGQDRAVKKISSILDRGWGGQCFWLSGASGTGKTTLARIIASQGADDLYIIEYDSADKVGVNEFEYINQTIQVYAGGKGGRAFIINEAHGLRKQIVRLFLGLLERIPDHVVIIFTTTKEGQDKLFEDDIDAGPLLSRCLHISLTNQGLAKAFGKLCHDIANKENLNGKPVEDYIKLAQKHQNNCRAMLQEIEAGIMLD